MLRQGLLPALLALGGCAGLPNQHEFTPVMPAVEFPQRAEAPVPNGAIYRAGTDLRLFEDRTARRIGDLLTIRLVERTNASKSATTTLDKSTGIGVGAPILFGGIVNDLEVDAEADSEFEGEGSSAQSNRLDGEITAVVVGVYPNGALQVRGEKVLNLNQGHEYIEIEGVVRPDDILGDNSVLSTQVADARITYGGSGAVADANVVGLLGRFFTSLLWIL